MANQNDAGCDFLSPTAIVKFTVAISQQAIVKPPNIIAYENCNCMHNPKQAHILVKVLCLYLNGQSKVSLNLAFILTHLTQLNMYIAVTPLNQVKDLKEENNTVLGYTRYTIKNPNYNEVTFLPCLGR